MSLIGFTVMFIGYLAYDRNQAALIRVEVQDTLTEVRRAFEEEARRDAQWMADEDDAFARLHDHLEELESRQLSIQSAITTANDDLNYRLGLHKGDHRLLESIIQHLDDISSESPGRHP